MTEHILQTLSFTRFARKHINAYDHFCDLSDNVFYVLIYLCEHACLHVSVYPTRTHSLCITIVSIRAPVSTMVHIQAHAHAHVSSQLRKLLMWYVRELD